MPEPIRDTVYFYKFNNYYNRIIKKYDTLVEYGDYLYKQENCNFVHGDGVNSTFTYNKPSTDTQTPDYVIVSDYNGNLSRWFVTNSLKVRDRQDKLTLRRDLIADYYSDIVKHSPCLIRKGYVDNESPFIFNDEGVKYNKIKEEEILIKDRSNCSYIVGFFANNAFNTDTTVNGTVKDTEADYYFDTIADFPFKNYVEGAGNTHSQSARIAEQNRFSTKVHYALKYSGKSISFSSQRNIEFFINRYGLNKPSGVNSVYSTQYTYQGVSYPIYYNSGTMANNCRLEGKSNTNETIDFYLVIKKYIDTFINRINFDNSDLVSYSKQVLELNENRYNDLEQYVGKKIKIGNVIYDCSWGTENVAIRDKNYTNYTSSYAWNSIDMAFNSYQPSDTDLSNAINYGQTLRYVNWNTKDYEGIADEIRVICRTEDKFLVLSPAVVNISTQVQAKANRTHLSEQPYDMFMMINESGVNYKVGVTDYVSNHEVNMNMAIAICQSAGSGSYDIQVVPFNPMQGTILPDDSINFYNFDTHEIKDADNNVVGHYIMCNTSDLKINIVKDELKLLPEDYKKDYNLKEYRLCSPNQETIFEFSPSINDGIESWNITANYRPYVSYIKVQPSWKGLYGRDIYHGTDIDTGLTDFRGLVYNSSLCVTQLNDAYSNYLSNNKNFQQLFDNQINTLTKTQNIELSAMEETLGLRSFTGMPIGSILRVIGGNKDIEMTRELNNVALSKMQTDFNYQMDNVKSMPHTIKKMTAINGDTRIFPFIEIYGAKDKEVQSFELKMQYTGYTIMTTGFIYSFLKEEGETFIQADLIRLDLSRSEETADNHIAVEIASELSKGVYLTKESE